MKSSRQLFLYRRRIIPHECILLKDDQIIRQTPETVITTWHTLNPKTAFHHGSSCYFLKRGYKVSKFYRADSSLLYWYCDIGEYQFNEDESSLTFTDLLADVIVYPDGRIKVLDLDEMAEALQKGAITQEQLTYALQNLNSLLTVIYNDQFCVLQDELNALQI